VFLKRTTAAAFSLALLASPCALQGQVDWPVTDLTHSGMDEPALNTLWQGLAADPHKRH